MPSPIFGVRLSQKTKDDLSELAKVYGAPTASAFAREVLEVITSGDMSRIQAFNRRLLMGMGEQLALKLTPEPRTR